ncbi:hypothetical protein CERSUDRAFT_120777 [Gelatoporia subvermispora B]|uniref:CSC1/OSCA1-like 7TM region domain-containing protein n=1 Tax=Ceriporiopsis subvermispora (strain B) TaxID=914234 RepID=M2RSF8_CERS8|nr:hypothetical protein CERSUDRAFT_120777 [Gelatoporia subvermispora B]
MAIVSSLVKTGSSLLRNEMRHRPSSTKPRNYPRTVPKMRWRAIVARLLRGDLVWVLGPHGRCRELRVVVQSYIQPLLSWVQSPKQTHRTTRPSLGASSDEISTPSLSSPSSAIPSVTPSNTTIAAGASLPEATSLLASTNTRLAPSASGFAAYTTSFPVEVTESSEAATFFTYPAAVASDVHTLLDTQNAPVSLLVNPVCIGDGVDTSSLGVLSVLVVSTVIGVLLWLLFAVIRPRYRQVYGLREWFVQQSLRPKPLDRSLFAFLAPSVPLIPSVPSDVSDTGKSKSTDARLFPTDEQLVQRTLWVCVLMVAAWSVLGLAGMLPLYMVSTPCLARSIPSSRFSGTNSVLQDLSLLRLLEVLDSQTGTTSDLGGLLKRSVDDLDVSSNVRIRIIILVVLTVLLGVLPILYKILKEFSKLVAYRERWIDFHCERQEIGWLSVHQAPGFVGWGEKRLKDFLVKVGFSSSLETSDTRNARSTRRRRAHDWGGQEKGGLEIDIQGLFSIGDTTQLALLIEERDEILENLEIAETKYINSFRLTTPDPSIADFEPSVPLPQEDPDLTSKPPISRPKPLGGAATRRRRRRGRNPAFGSSSLPPTSYVMPSQYYKIRSVEGLNSGEFGEATPESPIVHQRGPSLTDSFNQRVVGSRFQEVSRNSEAFGRIPMGSQLMLDESGQLGPARLTESPVPDPYRTNQYSSWDTTAFSDNMAQQPWFTRPPAEPIMEQEEPEEDWHDILQEDPEAFEHGEEFPRNTRRRPRPPRAKAAPPGHRETFPLRHKKNGSVTTEEVTPPHLRLQPRGPFVRPLSGLDHEALGSIYADISHWRSRLKLINAEITEAQRESYNDIADGMRIKGWLLVGRGLRYVPGVQLIEGRAKEDIRWDQLQYESSRMRTFAFWTAVVTIALMLGIGLTAVAGLALSSAPNFAHYFPFLQNLSEGNDLGSGIATCFAPAILAIAFTAIAVAIIHYTGQFSSSISISQGQNSLFKAIFWVLITVGGIWLFTVGAILFAFAEFSNAEGETIGVANGVIYMTELALSILLCVAVIFPALLMLQPIRLWRVLRAERKAVTPRQRFRAVYPTTYDPSYALACCILAVLYASAFSLIFPLVAPAALLFLLLVLIAHRFLIGYVYGRTQGQTGGLLQIWFLRRLGTILAFQPLLLGLILLSRRLWIEGGILCGTALFVVLLVETYCTLRTRQPSTKALLPITRDSIDTFLRNAQPGRQTDLDEENTSLVSSARNTRMRGSFASVLEMMSLTLAVMPSPSEIRGPVPLETETLDDLTATERAARTHPDAPPHLPPLPFADHAEEMAGILYAPELLAPPPVIWLPNDVGGIGRTEAADLEKYHSLRVTLDVRAKEDVLPRRSISPQSPRSPRHAS